MLLRDGRESLGDFADALAQEDKRVRANWEPLWHYRRIGFYYAQLKRYYETFDAAQIRVVLYDDFNGDPDKVMHDLFTFLEVDPTFEPDTSARLNVSMIPKNLPYHRLIAGENPLTAVVRAVDSPPSTSAAGSKVVWSHPISPNRCPWLRTFDAV